MDRYARWNALLELLTDSGRVTVEDAADRLDVSQATIRRDFDQLAQQQMITRTRGGAVANGVSYDLPLRYKTAKHSAEKQRIGAAAAALVAPGMVVGLNGGTTTTEVARALAAGVEVGADGERPRDLRHGGAAVQTDNRSRYDQPRRRLPDALLLGRVLGALVAQRQVVRDAVGDRAAPGPGDHLLLGELVEVAPDGGLRDVEPLGRVLDADPAAFGEQLQQGIPPRVPVHQAAPMHVL